MPNNFQLTCKITKKLVAINQIDKEICSLLDVPVHPKRYGGDEYDWFNIIGFKIAVGSPLGSEELRNYVTDTSSNGWGLASATKGEKILDYLENTYTSEAWA
tara:strand:- start:313 stop:618 length:306 start_codon:yes stop_codon:yes gene_type:complete